jgi:hypothetical protein
VLASHRVRVAEAGGRRFAPAESLPPGYSIPGSIGLPGAGISYRERQSAPRDSGLGWTLQLTECQVVQ